MPVRTTTWPKPFATEELLARLRGLLRRMGGHAEPTIRHGALELDTRSMRVTLSGVAVSLTALEYRILAYMMHRPDKVSSQTELTEHVYAQDFDRDFEHDRGDDRPAAQEARA